MDEPGLTHISIGAEDHRRLLDRVVALGGTVVTDTDIGVAVFIHDPDGQLIELLETKGLDVPDSKMLIDGKLVEAEGGATFDNVNPATEEVLGQVADGSAADMARAVAAARTRLRHHRLVDRPGAAASGASCSSRRRSRASGGAAPRARRRGRLPAAPHLRPAARRPAQGGAAVAGAR